MSFSEKDQSQNQYFKQICEYVRQAHGLTGHERDDELVVGQRLDKKTLIIKRQYLSEVLSRKDEAGREFIQVNFNDGKKILVTDTLIGFRPTKISDLDMAKLPKVVTTPDIKSIFEAIQEAMHSSDDTTFEEIEVLCRVFEAVVTGGESIGFDLTPERITLNRIPRKDVKASA